MSSLNLGDSIGNLTQAVENGTVAPPTKRKRDAQWKPGVEWSGDAGFVTTPIMPDVDKPNWDEVLAVFELDPNQFTVVEPVLFNAWNAMTAGGGIELMRQWKAKIVRKTASSVDIDELVKEIKNHKPSKAKSILGDSTLVVVFNDWQIGKSDGDGLSGTIRRVLASIDAVTERHKALQKLGYTVDEIVVIGLGDLIESIDGNYAMQTFSVEVDRRDQVKIARRLVRDAIMRWSKLVPKIRVIAIGGNHGENRKAGKAFTTLGDNDDVAIFEQIAEVFAANPEAYGHVEFAIPQRDLSMTVEVRGYILGATHGHTAKMGSGTSEQKLRRWVEKQSLGRQPIGDADIIVSGHYHTFRMADWGGVWWLQAPALDGGSEWWTAQSGDQSRSGMLSFVIAENGLRLVEVM